MFIEIIDEGRTKFLNSDQISTIEPAVDKIDSWYIFMKGGNTDNYFEVKAARERILVLLAEMGELFKL